MQLHWTGSTRFHDWYKNDKQIPRQMFSAAHKLGLIGEIEWVAFGPKDQQILIQQYRSRSDEKDQDVLLRLLDHEPPGNALFRIALGGASPFKWKVTLGLFPFDQQTQTVAGYNIINFWFDSELFGGKDGADRLFDGFTSLHNKTNSEFASIHHYQRWNELTDPLDGEYQDPLTISPMFTGIMWANFLDQNHLQYFNVEQLRDLKSDFLVWRDDELIIRICEHPSDAIQPEIEKEMVRLTEIFRQSRR